MKLTVTSGSVEVASLESAVDKLLTSGRMLSLAVSDSDGPWVSPVFYSVGERLDLYFLSERNTRHGKHLDRGRAAVAICVFQEPSGWGPGDLRGLQATALGFRAVGEHLDAAWVSYSRRFPEVSRYYRGPNDFAEQSAESALYVLRVVGLQVLYEPIFGPEVTVRAQVSR